jgi:thymidine phosphorylase
MQAYTDHEVADEQASALLMAILLQGMSDDEIVAWTDAMIASGTRLDLSGLGAPLVDKHSTGGVGDKVSLVLAPLVAACGAAVPQLSGRGLGHTGGTLDKLESIPGWRSNLSDDEIRSQLASVGCVICATTDSLAPADRKLYALRDVTATVESIPLIASSIMSKKIAEGTESLVLDVKVGSGAFIKDRDNAVRLAETMVMLGQRAGVKTTAVLTAMDQPLGHAVGNAVEVREAIDCLRGGGPEDLREITLVLAREMLALAGIDQDPESALDSGAAYDKWVQMVGAQGGDADAAAPTAVEVATFDAHTSGYVTNLDALAVGTAAWRLGAGRARKEDAVSPTAGVMCLVKVGDKVGAGDPLFELLHDDPQKLGPALEALGQSVTIADAAPDQRSLIVETIRG